MSELPILQANNTNELRTILTNCARNNNEPSGIMDSATLVKFAEKPWVDKHVLASFCFANHLADAAIKELESPTPREAIVEPLLEALQHQRVQRMRTEAHPEQIATIAILCHEQQQHLWPDHKSLPGALNKAEQHAVNFSMLYLEHPAAAQEQSLNRTLATQGLERMDKAVKQHQTLVAEQNLYAAEKLEGGIAGRVNYIHSLLEKTRDKGPALTQDELKSVMDACAEANRTELQEKFVRTAERAPKTLDAEKRFAQQTGPRQL
jgi:hypothetical protein